MEDAEAKAREINKSLSAYDFNPDFCIQIKTDEGCDWFLTSAFALSYERYYLIFAEHHNPICIAKNDVTWFAQYCMVHEKPNSVSSFRYPQLPTSDDHQKSTNSSKLTTVTNV